MASNPPADTPSSPAASAEQAQPPTPTEPTTANAEQTTPLSPKSKDEEALFDEKLLAMPTTSTLNDPRDAPLLADFDRYLDAPLDTEAGSAVQTPTPVAAAAAPRSEDEPIARLVALYPSYDADVLRAMLSSCDGQLSRVIELLSGPNTAASAPSVAATDAAASDAALAAYLQRQERRQVRHRHRRNGATLPVERPALDEMVATLREIVVPALHAHFAELVFPNFAETSAGIAYSLEQLEVSALSLPAENLLVRAASDSQSIRISVVNAYLELDVGRWRYEGTGLLPVKDAGRARITVQGLNVDIRLEPRWSYSGGTYLKICDCTVSIDGIVRFKTEGAAANWAYNTIAMLFKPLVVSYIKEAVGDIICAALSAHLVELAASRNLDRSTQQSAVRMGASPGAVAATGNQA